MPQSNNEISNNGLPEGFTRNSDGFVNGQSPDGSVTITNSRVENVEFRRKPDPDVVTSSAQEVGYQGPKRRQNIINSNNINSGNQNSNRHVVVNTGFNVDDIIEAMQIARGEGGLPAAEQWIREQAEIRQMPRVTTTVEGQQVNTNSVDSVNALAKIDGVNRAAEPTPVENFIPSAVDQSPQNNDSSQGLVETNAVDEALKEASLENQTSKPGNESGSILVPTEEGRKRGITHPSQVLGMPEPKVTHKKVDYHPIPRVALERVFSFLYEPLQDLEVDTQSQDPQAMNRMPKKPGENELNRMPPKTGDNDSRIQFGEPF